MSTTIPPNALEVKRIDLLEIKARARNVQFGLLALTAVEVILAAVLSSVIGYKGDDWFVFVFLYLFVPRTYRFDHFSIYTSTLEYIGIGLLRLVIFLVVIAVSSSVNMNTISSVKATSKASRLWMLTNQINFLLFWIVFLLLLLKSRDFDKAEVLVCSIISIVFSIASLAFVSGPVGKAVKTLAKDRFILSVLEVATFPLDAATERLIFPPEDGSENPFAAPEGAQLSFLGLFRVLRPYFWPRGSILTDKSFNAQDGSVAPASPTPATSTEAAPGVSATGKPVWVLRSRVCLTWFCIIVSKASSVYSPLVMGEITRRLVNDPTNGMVLGYVAGWVALNVVEKFFKEMTAVAYLPVKQEASVELRERVFSHIVEKMGYSWHVKRKLGQVTRAVDRGADAASQLTNYGFLVMGPSFVEAIVIAFIFLFLFENTSLSAIVFGGVFAYCYMTILITNWRSKLRREANKRDNKVHDVMADCLVNIETVKSFANEHNEVRRYANQVRSMLFYSSATERSLAVLNFLQQLTIFLTVGGALLVAGFNIVKNNSTDLDVGDFAAVLSYTTKVFAPFTILGTLYSIIVQSLVDIKNLSQLLGMQSDIQDKPNAPPVRPTSPTAPAISFKDVHFDYLESTNIILVDAKGRAIRTENVSAVGLPTGLSPAQLEDERRQIQNAVCKRYRAGAAFRNIEAPLVANRNLAETSAVTPTDTNASRLEEGDASSQTGLMPRPSSPANGGKVKIYPSGHVCSKGGGLHGVTFDVKEGETVGIVGHTGSGKTTLTRVLMRFLEPAEGSVEVFGNNVRDVTQQSLRGEVFGTVPQDCVLFNDSILYNLLYGHKEAQKVLNSITQSVKDGSASVTTARAIKNAMGAERFNALIREVESAVEAAQLMDFINKAAENVRAKRIADNANSMGGGASPMPLLGNAPNSAKLENTSLLKAGALSPTPSPLPTTEDEELAKWDLLVGERGLKLSGGEKQRVSIARCLLKNPKILIFDEATSALDTQTESQVQKAIDALTMTKRGEAKRTCLVIAHRLSTIRNADKIIVLHNGKIAEMGTHQQLLQAPPIDKISLLDDIDDDSFANVRQQQQKHGKPLGIYARLWAMQQASLEDKPLIEEEYEEAAKTKDEASSPIVFTNDGQQSPPPPLPGVQVKPFDNPASKEETPANAEQSTTAAAAAVDASEVRTKPPGHP